MTRARSLIFVTIWCLVMGVVACGDDSGGKDNAGNNSADAGDAGTLDDSGMVNPDAGDPDMATGTDRDEDGVPDDVDNCPDDANESQIDRDRDGVGNVCDAFQNYHDPANPQTLDRIVEDESVLPNNSQIQGEAYDIVLPFAVSGDVGAVENGEPDFDFYSFEITEPTALLIDFDGSEEFWAGAILFGYDWRNANINRALIPAEVGQPDNREIWLPTPGKYTLLVSDARNLIESAADVGGDEFTYTFSISALPLPEVESVDLPSPSIPITYDKRLKVFEVDTAGLDTFTVEADGIALDQNSFHFSAVSLWDPDAEETLSFSAAAQVDDTGSVSLTTRLSEVDRLWVIEDNTQRFGQASSSLTFSTDSVTSELETAQAPANTRDANFVWLTNGTSLEGQIGPPQPSGPTTLEADTDYYPFMIERGDAFRVTVTPAQGSQFIPEVDVGHFAVNGQSSIFVQRFQAPPPETTATPSSLHYLVSALEDGEFGVRVNHLDNAFATNPVGGAAYGYTIEIKEWQPTPLDLGTTPVDASTTIEDGKVGVATFEATAGDLLRIGVDSSASLFLDGYVLDSNTFEELTGRSDDITFRVPADGTYTYLFSDFRGQGSSTDPVTITIDGAGVTPFGNAGDVVSGAIDTEGKVDLYSIDLTAGDVVDVRVFAPEFLSRIEFFGPDFNRRFSTIASARQIVVGETGTHYVGVSHFNDEADPSFTYDLGVEVIVPTDLGMLPATASTTLDDAPYATWYALEVTQGTRYAVEATTTASDLDPRIRVINSTAGFVDSSTSGVSRWTSSIDGTVYIVVHDGENGGDPAWDVDVSARELTGAPIMAGDSLTGSLDSGVAEDLYEFSVSPGATEVIVEVTGDWYPEIDVLSDQLNNVSEARSVGNTVKFAFSEARDVVIAVGASDASLTGPLDYTISVNVTPSTASIAETEPNDVTADAQTVTSGQVVAGTVGGADTADIFALEPISGQRVWALGTDRNMQGIFSASATMNLLDPAESLFRSDSFAGEGFFPAFFGLPAESSGTWTVLFEPRDTMWQGDYFLYFFTSPANDLSETEPNDTFMTAESLGVFGEANRIAASVDGTDTVDYFEFTLARTAQIEIKLENASSGHTLRLLDGAGTELAASGPGFDALTDPVIAYSSAAPGDYVVELGNGSTAGTADVIVNVSQ